MTVSKLLNWGVNVEGRFSTEHILNTVNAIPKDNNKFRFQVSHMPTIFDEDGIYIDRTLSIKTFLESKNSVLVATAPGASGKTLLLTMLDCFFNVDNKKYQWNFKNLKIASAQDSLGVSILKHQNKYPLLYISMFSISGNYEEVKVCFAMEMSDLYKTYYQRLRWVLTKEEREVYEKVLYRDCDENLLINSLSLLMKFLHRLYQCKVIVLINDYDRPYMKTIAGSKDAEQILTFFQRIYHTCFHENNDLSQAMLMGQILLPFTHRFEYQPYFMGEYSEFFGVNSNEIRSLFPEASYQELNQLRAWCGGFGEKGDKLRLWSVMHYHQDRYFQNQYWIGPLLILDDVVKSCNSYEWINQLKNLIDNKEMIIESAKLYEPFTHQRLSDSIEAFYILLLNVGLLTCKSKDSKYVALKIPNSEALEFLKEKYQSWYAERNQVINLNHQIKVVNI